VTFEYERLVKERTSHCNRVTALLFAKERSRFRRDGGGSPGAPGGVEDHAAPEGLSSFANAVAGTGSKPTSPRSKLKMAAKDRPAQEGQTQERGLGLRRARCGRRPRSSSSSGAKAAISATVLAGEVYYRTFRNRRGVGQYIGLAPSPFQSGDMARDQGIAKAGAKRARKSDDRAVLALAAPPTD
jgi:transposase